MNIADMDDRELAKAMGDFYADIKPYLSKIAELYSIYRIPHYIVMTTPEQSEVQKVVDITYVWTDKKMQMVCEYYEAIIQDIRDQYFYDTYNKGSA